ncbi:MAG: hypothetical protein KF900_14230 [Bacteroidetes bacterium]|nr:hypothetical protein [Bacteroidota bacterium]
MKKLTVILSTALLLLSSNLSAHRYLACYNGQAYILNNDDRHNVTKTPAGGCCCGKWIVQLDFIAPTGNPNVPEASEALYAALNTPPDDPSAQPTEEEGAEMQAVINSGTVSAMWINPLKLNAAAYALVYGGTTHLPLFYVNTSINTSTNDNELTLYSDSNRDITVTYKLPDLTVVGSENLSLTEGYNSQTLNTASLSNGTYIMTVSTSDGYNVNLTLIVNH